MVWKTYGAPFVSKLFHETWIQKTKFALYTEINSIFMHCRQKLTQFLTHKNRPDF